MILDNKSQVKWCQIMKPVKALLKFRCPFPHLMPENKRKIMKSFSGTIYFETFAGPTSSETRLVPDSYEKLIEYDCKDYEDKLYYHI